MHMSDEQRKEKLKQAVSATIRDMLKDKDELIAKGQTMRQVWNAVISSPTLQIMHSAKPDDFDEPEEIWSIKPTIIRR